MRAGDNRHVVCTLAEGRYFYGVAALANSLARAGFEGDVVVGYRGDVLDWVRSLEPCHHTGCYAVTPSVRMTIVEIPGDWHLSNCKPNFMKRMLTDYNADLVYYFDPDIVIRHPWHCFAEWARNGVVTVLDPADSYMPPYHVYRCAWRALAAKRGHQCRDFTGYVNGGCIGVARPHASLLEIWSGLMDELEHSGADMSKMKNPGERLEFSRMDQDVLNAAIMAADTPMAVLGSEAMGMYPWVGEIMPHAMWHRKPWDRNYILDALRGFPPGRVHRSFWDFAEGPIHAFPRATLARKRAALAIGHVIGLLHTRSYRDL